MNRRLVHHIARPRYRNVANVWRGALFPLIAFALLTLPALAWAIPWVIPDIDAAQGTAFLTAGRAPNAAGNITRGAGLSAAQSMSSSSSGNLAVSAGAAQEDEASSIPDGAGGAIIVWDDNRSAIDPALNAGFDIYAKHVLACGALDPTWPAEGVRISGGGGDRHWTVTVTDGSGGALIVWPQVPPGSSERSIYAQHLLNTGMVDPSWPVNGLGVCTAPGDDSNPKVTSDGAHGAFVTWNDRRFVVGQRKVFVQHLLSTGVDPSWAVNGIRACPAIDDGNQTQPEICSDGAGGAIVTWNDQRGVGGPRDVYAQRMSNSGAPLWSPAGVPVCTATGPQGLMGNFPSGNIGVLTTTWTDIQSNSIVPDGVSGCFVTWTDGRTLASTGSDVYAQHLTASGGIAAGWAPDGVALCTAPGDQIFSTILSDGAGGAIASWDDSRASVFAQHVSASGVVDGPPNGAVLSTVAGEGVTVGVSDGSGGAIFTWGGDILAQHVRTVPTFSVDPAWPVNGAAVTTPPAGGDISSGGGLVSNGSGGAIVFWADYRDYDPKFQDIYAQAVLADGTLPLFSAVGHVRANCPSPNTGLLGVTVDAYQVGSGDLVGSAATDATGAYTIPNLSWGSSYTLTDVTPLDYASLANDLPANGCSGPIDFALQCRPATGTVQSMGFWKHEVGVATGGNGHAQISPATLCSYLDLIAAHFNSNAINQVIVYQPPASGVCADKLQVARVLLDLQGNVAMIARARQQLLSLLLNVAAGYISQTKVISTDGATVSQAITYCDNLIDSPTGNYEKAKTIADTINNGMMVPAGMVPLSTAQIAYRRGMEAASFRVTPNPGHAAREFRFMTGARGPVSLRVFDVSGRLVAEVCSGNMDAGAHSVGWNGRTSSGVAAPRGLYFARLQTPRESPTIKVLQLTAGH